MDTLTGAFGGTTVTLTTNSNSDAVDTLLSSLANSVNTGGTSYVAGSTPPPTVPAGQIGVVIDEGGSGSVTLNNQYQAAVISSPSPVAVLGLGTSNSVAAGSSGLVYVGRSQSSVAAGGGDNLILNYGAGSTGSSTSNTVSLGSGNDTVALNGGTNTVSTGGGNNLLILQGGNNNVTSSGADTIYAGWLNSGGADNIDAQTNTSGDTIYGGNANINFIGGSGANSVLGGSGSDTLYGGGGTNYLQGGTSGHNYLQGGSGSSTLVGGADGDVMAGGSGVDHFTFTNSFTGGGQVTISNFNLGQDQIDLVGLTYTSLTNTGGGGSVITLSDGTKVTVSAQISDGSIHTS